MSTERRAQITMARQAGRGDAAPAAQEGKAPADPPGRTAERGRELAQLIVAHALRVGLGQDGRLPTERQLAKDLGVTRSSIRYALAILQAQGRLSREVGRGTYLRAAPGGAAGTGVAWTTVCAANESPLETFFCPPVALALDIFDSLSLQPTSNSASGTSTAATLRFHLMATSP